MRRRPHMIPSVPTSSGPSSLTEEIRRAPHRSSLACGYDPLVIRVGIPSDIKDIQEVERSANAMFRSVGMDAVAEYPVTAASDLLAMMKDRRAWVAVDDQDRPIACILLTVIDGNCHVEQIAVRPEFARQRIGEKLIAKAEDLARERGLAALTLTTFTHVPWNGPYYARLGFHIVDKDRLSAGERAIQDDNTAGVLGAWPRVTMTRPINRASSI